MLLKSIILLDYEGFIAFLYINDNCCFLFNIRNIFIAKKQTFYNLRPIVM
jgi:hypothetical protein